MMVEESKVMCDGKVLIMDFSRLQEEDFPYLDFETARLQDQWGVPAINGQLYINKNMPDAEEFLVPILEVLMKESHKELNKFQRMNRKKYKNLSFDNLTKFIKNSDDKSVVRAIYYLLIPMEKTRRFIERTYDRNKK